MNWALFFDAVIAIVVVVLAVFIVLVLIELFKTLRSVNNLIKDLGKEIIPTLLKLQESLDQINNELSKVSGVIEAVEDISDKVNVITRLTQEVLSPSLIKLAGIKEGAKTIFSKLLIGK